MTAHPPSNPSAEQDEALERRLRDESNIHYSEVPLMREAADAIASLRTALATAHARMSNISDDAEAELKEVYAKLAEAQRERDEQSNAADMIAKEREAYRREVERLRGTSIAELATVNVDVRSYMEHWEGRATKAEALASLLRRHLRDECITYQRESDSPAYFGACSRCEETWERHKPERHMPTCVAALPDAGQP